MIEWTPYSLEPIKTNNVIKILGDVFPPSYLVIFFFLSFNIYAHYGGVLDRS